MNLQENKYYLYRHIRLDKNEVFYVGVGQKTKHYTSYKKEYRRAFEKNTNRTNYWKNIINQTDYEVEIVLESNNYDFILEKEKEFIKLYGRKDLGLGVLVNLNNGGGGNKGYKLPNDKRKLLSENRKNEFKNGTRSKASFSKIVFRYNLDGKFIDEFPSVVAASIFTHISKESIYKATTNKSKICGGYYWSYNKMDIISIPCRRKNTKKVCQYDLKGNFIKEWEDLYAITHSLNVDRDRINNNLINKSKSSCGFIWKYK